VLVTAGSAEKLQRCFELGADDGVNYRVEDFAERFAGQADVILDIIGAAYLPRNIAALATGGRLVVIGLQGGTRGELNLGTLLAKRASVHASGLRARPVAEKAVICREVVEHVWPLIGAGRIRPVVHAEVPLQEAARAHRMLEASEHVGKILLVR